MHAVQSDVLEHAVGETENNVSNWLLPLRALIWFWLFTTWVLIQVRSYSSLWGCLALQLYFVVPSKASQQTHQMAPVTFTTTQTTCISGESNPFNALLLQHRNAYLDFEPLGSSQTPIDHSTFGGSRQLSPLPANLFARENRVRVAIGNKGICCYELVNYCPCAIMYCNGHESDTIIISRLQWRYMCGLVWFVLYYMYWILQLLCQVFLKWRMKFFRCPVIGSR